MVKRNPISILTFIFAALMFLTCAVNPVTGKRELMLFSQADEIALGKTSDQEIIAMYGLYDDAKLQQYINQLGSKMTPITHQPGLPYKFQILDTDVVNAFAVPGGYVYFTRGILAYFNDEAELAGVMGHELGHVNARHSAKTLSEYQLAQIGLQVGSALSETFAKFSGLAGLGVEMLFLRFSRDNEREADNLGVEYSTKTGYDSNGMATFFETLERMSPSEDSGIPDWFSTHPNPVDRINAVRKKTLEWQQKTPGKTFVLNPEQYVSQVDGLVFGPDPRQGYVEANMFYHPELKIQFPVPSGWTINNTPSQVQMVSPQEDAVMLFTMVSAGSLSEAASQFIQSSQATELNRLQKTIQGFSALEMNSQITGDQPLRLISNFISGSGHIYAFHCYSTDQLFTHYSPQFTKTMYSYRTLTDPGKIHVKPQVLRIRTLPSAMTLAQFLGQQKIAAKDYESIAIMNGMQLNVSLPKNTRVKLITSE